MTDETEPFAAYSADRSLKGKLRRRLVRLALRRPARVRLERPMVSFTFDDAPATATHAGAQALEARGVRGAYYVSAGLAGREGPMGRYATRDETMAVQAAGHELACHTYSHIDCGAAPQGVIEADVARNHATLADWGASELTNFAYPYGDVSHGAKAALGARYKVLRALNHGLIEDGTDLNQAPAVGIEGPNGEATARGWLERAIRRKAWLILYTHDVAETPTEWGCTPDALARLIDAAQAGGCDIVTVAEGARRIGAQPLLVLPRARRYHRRGTGATMESWYGFFQATAGASATLIGMLVVAISINLSRILSIAHLPARAAGALAPLAGALVVSILAFVPAQPPAAFGAETLVAGVAIWVMTGLFLLRSMPDAAAAPLGKRWSHLLLAQAQSLPFVAAGVLLIAGGPGGVYWIVPGMAFAILGGVLNTWVLLVEILR